MAQGYESPSRELVETLLEQLDECKRELTEAENGISLMEKSPGEYTLATYLATKDFIKKLKNCIKSSRSRLERIRKDYPGWFNSPSAFSDIRLSWPKINSPKEMEEALARMRVLMAQVIAQYEILEEPED